MHLPRLLLTRYDTHIILHNTVRYNDANLGCGKEPPRTCPDAMPKVDVVNACR
jgi:hypothetical protein